MSSTINTVSPSRTNNRKATMIQTMYNKLTDEQREAALAKSQTMNPFIFDVSNDREITDLLQDAVDFGHKVNLPQGAYTTLVDEAYGTYFHLVSPKGEVVETWELAHDLAGWSDTDLKWCGLNRNGTIRATRKSTTKRTKRTKRSTRN